METVNEFVETLFLFFPPEGVGKDGLRTFMQNYVQNIEYEITQTRKRYDLNKLLMIIQRNYGYKHAPQVRTILHYMPEAIIHPVGTTSFDRNKKIKAFVKVATTNSYHEVIIEGSDTVTPFLREKIKREFNKWTEVLEIIFDPTGTAQLIGNNIITEEG